MTLPTGIRLPPPRPLPLVAALTLAIAPPGAAQLGRVTRLDSTGTFQTPGLTESSGVAVSRQHHGLLWTHNDSGNEPLLYATDLTGADLGAYRIRRVEPRDWEDIALGPCPERDADCLYIADTGDNRERRRRVVIYILPEPDPPPRRSGRPPRVTARGLTVTFPDRPHDVEALAVSPNGEILLITKGRSGPVVVFQIPREAVRKAAVTPQPVDTLALVPQQALGRLVTGAAFSPSGERLVVRTYTQLMLYRLDQAGRLEPDGAPCWLGPREPQGEGVDFLDEETMVLTSEKRLGRPGMIGRVRCPPETPAFPAKRHDRRGATGHPRAIGVSSARFFPPRRAPRSGHSGTAN